jgi:hypothetical protein
MVGPGIIRETARLWYTYRAGITFTRTLWKQRTAISGTRRPRSLFYFRGPPHPTTGDRNTRQQPLFSPDESTGKGTLENAPRNDTTNDATDDSTVEKCACKSAGFDAGFDAGWDGGVEFGLIKGAFESGKIARYDEDRAADVAEDEDEDGPITEARIDEALKLLIERGDVLTAVNADGERVYYKAEAAK